MGVAAAVSLTAGGGAREGDGETDEVSGALSGRYVPALDGVRAMAVAAVIAYHFGAHWASGGYLGVDLFFVLSGFLITTLLLEEWHSSATIKLGAFWARRARRLLPALLVMLAAVALYVALDGRFGPPASSLVDLSGLRGDGLATLFYVANWHSIFAHQSYFAQFSAPSPLEHTWSLAIEEQFYLVWPLVILALVSVTRRHWRRAGIVFSVTGALASALAMALLYRPGTDPTMVYFGTGTRAFDMLAGATVAMLCVARPMPGPAARRVLHVAGLLSAVLLGCCWMWAGSGDGLPPGWMFRGGFLACAVLAAVIVADVRQVQSGGLGRALSLPPIRWVGMISYGLYLWHWPVEVFMSAPRTGLSGAPLDAARLAVTFAAATASFYVVERPVRAWRAPAWRQVATVPVAAGLVAACLVVGTLPAVATRPVAPVHLAAAKVAAPAAVAGAGGFADQQMIALPSGRVVSAADPLRVLLLGDSVAQRTAPALGAALASTGEAVLLDESAGGWGLTTSAWVLSGGLSQLVASEHPDIVMAEWSWDDQAALDDPAGYTALLEQAVRELLAPGDGVAGVLFLQFPKIGPPLGLLTPNLLSPTQLAAERGQNDSAFLAWASIARSMTTIFPGRVMYLPAATSILLHGRFSAWLPPIGDPSAPPDRWLRVRAVDNIHPCAAGAARYAAAVLADTQLIFGLPVGSNAWQAGEWSEDAVYTSPPGWCPDDHPPPSVAEASLTAHRVG
jgi:peptidoglycan/LPS O-acetylase OafA/YrhL